MTRVRSWGSVFCVDADRDGASRARRQRHGLDQPSDVVASRLPFGGIMLSGHGRELARLGMHEFVNRKLNFAAAPDAPIGGFAG